MKPKHRGNRRRDLGGRWCASTSSVTASNSQADDVEKFLLANGGKPVPEEITGIGFIGGVPPKRKKSQ